MEIMEDAFVVIVIFGLAIDVCVHVIKKIRGRKKKNGHIEK